MNDYPVGICTDRHCGYQEPHRHGFACNRLCACEGIGAETRPMSDFTVDTCDWGDCDRPTVAERLDRDPIGREWLGVCSWHAGFDDYESDTA